MKKLKSESLSREQVLKIDKEFFQNYAGSGKSYSRVWRDHCYFDECCAMFLDKNGDLPKPKSVCVLGTATGEVCKGFYKKMGVKVYGCEISQWAHSRTPAAYVPRVKNTDMLDYVDSLLDRAKNFDLVFTNSLVYLPERKVSGFLKKLSHLTRYVHFRSSFRGSACPDPWRRTLRSYAWWKAKFKQAGFSEVVIVGERESYLWMSKRF